VRLRDGGHEPRKGWPTSSSRTVAQHAAGRFVDLENVQGLGIDQVDAFARLVDDGAVLLLAFGQASRVRA
jgi:hypothetical protein